MLRAPAFFFRVILAAVVLAVAGAYLAQCIVAAVRAEINRQP
jgi:hypothetical protein